MGKGNEGIRKQQIKQHVKFSLLLGFFPRARSVCVNLSVCIKGLDGCTRQRQYSWERRKLQREEDGCSESPSLPKRMACTIVGI